MSFLRRRPLQVRTGGYCPSGKHGNGQLTMCTVDRAGHIRNVVGTENSVVKRIVSVQMTECHLLEASTAGACYAGLRQRMSRGSCSMRWIARTEPPAAYVGEGAQ